jgi:hypothetical protein
MKVLRKRAAALGTDVAHVIQHDAMEQHFAVTERNPRAIMQQRLPHRPRPPHGIVSMVRSQKRSPATPPVATRQIQPKIHA